MYCKYWLPAVCLLLLVNCAKHKLTPVATPFPSAPTMNVPVPAPAPAIAESTPAEPAKKVAQVKRSASDVNRLLLDPPRMSFAPDVRALRKDVPRIDKITFLVNTGDGTMRPESETTVHAALQALSDQFLFLCPDQMRVGAPAECHFKTKEGLNDFFRVKLLELGVQASEAGAASVLVHADLISADDNAFDIRAASPSNPSSGEQLWHVTARNPGDHKLELSVTPSARILSVGDVQGTPVVLTRFISVAAPESFFNDYGPAVIGSLAALGLLAWIAWTLWRNARPSVFSSR
jgi:hypothetical protein